MKINMTPLIVSMAILPFTLSLRAEVPHASATTAGEIGESQSAGSIDLLVPVFRRENNLFFLDPRGYASSEEVEQFSLGLGWRYYQDTTYPILWGANLFYDSSNSPYDHRYEGWGAGVEALSEWVDFRANYYSPETTQNLIDSRETRRSFRESGPTKSQVIGKKVAAGTGLVTKTIRTTGTGRIIRERTRFEQREAALEGWDAELGVRLPRLGETRAFFGYESYENPFGGGNFSGLTARLESRITRGVVFDLKYFEEDAIRFGDQWFAGVRVQLPLHFGEGTFSENLRSAFRREDRSTRDRFEALDPIGRSPLRTTTGPWRRVLHERSVTTTRSSSVFTIQD